MATQRETAALPRRLRGREVQALDNDRRVLAAAAEVLAVNPAAPMAEVAHRAGVGQASLYRRYRNRDDLLRALCIAGMKEAQELANSSLGAAEEGRAGFIEFVHRYLDSKASMLLVLGGQFPPDDELVAMADATHAAIEGLIALGRRQRYLRPGITALDLALLVTQLARRPLLGSSIRDRELAHRYLDLALAGLLDPDAPFLAGIAPTRQENLARWNAQPSA